MVAFANSVPEDKTAVLFIGISDDGDIVGVKDTDSLQKRINDAFEDCYPSILYHLEVLEKTGQHIVAVEIYHSKERPHFSGPAYIRNGSESIKASKAKYDELIATRLSKPYEILKWKDKVISVQTAGKKLGSSKFSANPGARHSNFHECRIEECTAHTNTLKDIATDKYFSEPLDNISLSKDTKGLNRLLLIVRKPY